MSDGQLIAAIAVGSIVLLGLCGYLCFCAFREYNSEEWR